MILYNYRVNLAQNASLHFHDYLQRLCSECSHLLKIQPGIIAVTEKMELQAIGQIHRQIVQDKCEFYASADYTVLDTLQIASPRFQPAPQGFLDSYIPQMERAVIKKTLKPSVALYKKSLGLQKQCLFILAISPGIYPLCSAASS